MLPRSQPCPGVAAIPGCGTRPTLRHRRPPRSVLRAAQPPGLGEPGYCSLVGLADAAFQVPDRAHAQLGLGGQLLLGSARPPAAGGAAPAPNPSWPPGSIRSPGVSARPAAPGQAPL